MKINDRTNSPADALGGPRLRPAAQNPGQPAAPAAARVELSPLSARLQEIATRMGSEPAVNAERVAEIKQAIAEGRFSINPERIASGLLIDVRELLAERQ